jgi:hypothetical protein
MVIARIETEWLMGWSVKVGAVFPLTQQYASAKVLAAFQLEGRRNELAEVIATHDRISGKKALAALDRISSEGGNFSNDDGYTRILPIAAPSSRDARSRPDRAARAPGRSPPAKPPRSKRAPQRGEGRVGQNRRQRWRLDAGRSPSSTTQAAPLTCAAPSTPGTPQHGNVFGLP